MRGSSVESNVVLVAKRSKYVILALFVIAVYGSWSVYEHQFLKLPNPLGAEQVGKRGFSEHEAIKHVIALTQLGPHPVASDALDHALDYVLQAIETIKQTAHWEVDVELDVFHAKSGANTMIGGLFKGKTLVYSDLNHIVLRISPKYTPQARENAILVSSHIDTVFSAPSWHIEQEMLGGKTGHLQEAVVHHIRGLQGEETFWDLRFRRDFQDLEVNEFQRLLALLHHHREPTDRLDTLKLKLGSNWVFSVKSFYEKLLVKDVEAFPIKSIWIPKVPRKRIACASEGAGDCSSCVAVMLELARGVSQWAHGFKNAVIFLFNTGEEEGLNGAHSFITQICVSTAVDWNACTQHSWSDTVTVAIDLEAMGVGGKSGIFQAGPQPWAIETFALAAKFPSGQIVAQDIFKSGAIKSATDFQVYQELAGLSGLDFAYADNTAVYHTKIADLVLEINHYGSYDGKYCLWKVVVDAKYRREGIWASKVVKTPWISWLDLLCLGGIQENDKLKLLKPGSLQHLGENMLAFLLKAGTSTNLPKGKGKNSGGKSGQDTAIYFDILGTYMVVFRQRFASMLYNSMILQALLIWMTSLIMGGYSALVSLALSSLSLMLMWMCAIGFSVLVAFVLPLVSSSPIPFISSPWLVVGLFGAPAVLGAFTGQHVGYLILLKHLTKTFSRRNRNLPLVVREDLAKLDAERWLFKAGLMQWLVLLIVGNFYKIGSSYLALAWLATPAFAYGLLEATLSPARLPKPLKTLTLLIGLSVPFLLSSGIIIHLVATLIGTAVRLERSPGSNPEWLGNVIVAIFIAAIACLTLAWDSNLMHSHLAWDSQPHALSLGMRL
ncbi:putative homeobox-leucine zipper protein REVOLUTA-like [Capsicum annuum]|nr:putative homeobox-leucine zipper protein REVOLUTA-like [Capsicum annuum]